MTPSPTPSPSPSPRMLLVHHWEQTFSVADPEALLAADVTLTPSDDFALQVTGDCMAPAGILDGDYVLIRPDPTPALDQLADGTIVAAQWPDPDTGEPLCALKYLYRAGPVVRLVAADPLYEPIEITVDQLTLLGTVIAVLRPLEPSIHR